MILAKYSSFAKILQGCCDRWKNLRTLLRELRHDPYYVSKYPIPLFEGDTGIFNNLPSPDFDDTGFIGRQVELAELLAALEGPYPVITIIGEGGVGKTALALKACYTLNRCHASAVRRHNLGHCEGQPPDAFRHRGN
jgi:hypothetical protein